ncbi:hypothetical protein HPP92_027480 [Vanilla planifolia]|uniref:Uncharacterized protein n=1 Tax=Vanilla planifolia TaxID=51239 RepID=A0A835U557_VANPL|nr:hypothetical protein HPP92_027480 [Vanilla planifolia]
MTAGRICSFTSPQLRLMATALCPKTRLEFVISKGEDGRTKAVDVTGPGGDYVQGGSGGGGGDGMMATVVEVVEVAVVMEVVAAVVEVVHVTTVENLVTSRGTATIVEGAAVAAAGGMEAVAAAVGGTAAAAVGGMEAAEAAEAAEAVEEAVTTAGRWGISQGNALQARSENE